MLLCAAAAWLMRARMVFKCRLGGIHLLAIGAHPGLVGQQGLLGVVALLLAHNALSASATVRRVSSDCCRSVASLSSS